MAFILHTSAVYPETSQAAQPHQTPADLLSLSTKQAWLIIRNSYIPHGLVEMIAT